MKLTTHVSAAGLLRRTSFVVCAAVIVPFFLALGGQRAWGQSAKTDYKRGQAAEARQDIDTAYAEYLKAYQKKPDDLRYRTALERVRTTDSNYHLTQGRQLFQAGNLQGALAEFLHAAEVDPGNQAAQQEIARVRQAQAGVPQPSGQSGTPAPVGEQTTLSQMGSPVQLQPVSNEPLTLHMNEDAKVVYQAIGKAAGINVLFDPDYTSRRIQVDLSNVSLMDALRIVGAMSNTFWRPVTKNTIFVAQNTRIKRTELDEQAVQTFYLTNAWQQNDLNDIQTALRNVLPNAKVYGVASQNAIVMRGTPDELLLAEKLIDDLDKPRSEVVVDFGVLEVSKNWERTLGIAWPQSIGVQLQSPQANAAANSSTLTGTTTGISPTIYDLAHLKGSDFAVNVGAAQLNLLLNNSNTQILQDPRVRATDGQKATLTIGSKIPIATGSYSAPGITPTAAIGYAQTQFQYIDVGVKIEMTPTIHYDGDVTLKIHVETSAQTSQVTIEGVTEPIISQRVADQVIRLRDGQASILGGIQSNTNQETWTGLPGLSSIPILRYLFGSKDHTINNDDIVFVVVPHIVREQDLTQANLRPIDTGSGQSIDLRLLQHTAASAQNPAEPTAYVQRNYGTLPAASVSAAAMQAMSQLQSKGENMQMPPPISHPEKPLPPVNTPPGTPPPNGTPLPPAKPAAQQKPAAQPGAAPQGAASFLFQAPPGQVQNGSTFQVPIALNNGTDVTSVPLQFTYDPSKLTLVNVTGGNLLSKDGQAMALIHRDDGPGDVTVVASRPPGTQGVSGSGVVCVLTFQAKTPGATALTMTRAGVVNSSQQQTPAQATTANIVVK
ncbi:MAG: cohesin domain-containing protein [Acidobacteriota bacterium]